MENQNWYSNKDIFEMLENFKNEIVELRMEMQETKLLIRDYNDLRGKTDAVCKDMVKLREKVDAHAKSRREYVGYIIAIISILFMILNYVR